MKKKPAKNDENLKVNTGSYKRDMLLSAGPNAQTTIQEQGFQKMRSAEKQKN